MTGRKRHVGIRIFIHWKASATERRLIMTEHDTESLKQELEQFKAEKEKIRAIVGSIGGAAVARRDLIINVLFITVILALVATDVVRHTLSVEIGSLPPMLSLEIGVLMVSLKIIWMIHKQAKVEHFQFWILNSIEFRLNDLSNRMRNIQSKMENEDKP